MVMDFRYKQEIMIKLMILGGLLLILDRLTKVLAQKGVLKLFENKSLFFLNINQEWLTVGVGLILFILIIQLTRVSKKQDKYLFTGLLLIFLGGLSNFFDRVVYGFVIDMFEFYWVSVFNLADVMIIGGCALILFKVIRPKRK